MYFHALRDSGAGSLEPGETYEATWPGHDPDRYGSIQEALSKCPKDWVVLKAHLVGRYAANGDPLWEITRVSP